MNPRGPSAEITAPPPHDHGCLLVASACGDKAAFEALFHHFAPRVKAGLMRAGALAEVADEIVQDIMLTVWRRAGEYDPERFSPAAWIFTIARNRRIDLLRREQRPEIDSHDPELRLSEKEDANTALSCTQIGSKLRNAIGVLPEEQEDALFTTFFSNKSYGDYAEESGLPLRTVKSRLRLALARLRLELKEAL